MSQNDGMLKNNLKIEKKQLDKWAVIRYNTSRYGRLAQLARASA